MSVLFLVLSMVVIVVFLDVKYCSNALMLQILLELMEKLHKARINIILGLRYMPLEEAFNSALNYLSVLVQYAIKLCFLILKLEAELYLRYSWENCPRAHISIVLCPRLYSSFTYLTIYFSLSYICLKKRSQ